MASLALTIIQVGAADDSQLWWEKRKEKKSERGSEQENLLEVMLEKKKETVSVIFLFSQVVKQKKNFQDIFSVRCYLIDKLTFDRHSHPCVQLLPQVSYSDLFKC